jgi:hypothetical protein
MNKQRKERPAASVSEMLRDALGLPPGDKAPHGKGRPARDPKSPHGGLTSDDPTRRDGTPVNGNSATDE